METPGKLWKRRMSSWLVFTLQLVLLAESSMKARSKGWTSVVWPSNTLGSLSSHTRRVKTMPGETMKHSAALEPRW
jgi:hypothetical protein